MPNEAQNLVSPESLERKHEVSDKRVRNVLLVGGGSGILLVFSLAVCALALHWLAKGRPMQWMPPLGILIAPNLQPLERFPKPNLQLDDDHSERLALYATQDNQLNSYGWIDRSNGIVRIPIDRAMDLISQRGLASKGEKITSLQLMRERPESR